MTEANGSHEDYDEKTGQIYWGEFSKLHDTLNIGTTPYIALLVEVKNATSPSTASGEAAMRATLATADQLSAPIPGEK